MSARSLSCLVLILALTAMAPRAVAGVIVVALDGSGDTDSFTDALDMAAPGDLILLREGNYVPPPFPLNMDSFHYIQKPLTIVGDGAGATIGGLRVFDIVAGSEVVLRNLTLAGPFMPGFFVEALGVHDCAGTVLVEDCSIVGLPGNPSEPQGFPGVTVSNSDGVTLTRCNVRGGQGRSGGPFEPFFISPGPGGPAIVVDDSKLALHHCTVIGGAGGTDEVGPVEPREGGAALTIGPAATTLVAGGSITGGHGTDGGDPGLSRSAYGGDGIVQTGTFSTLRLIDLVPQGGEGGLMSDASSAPDGEGLVVTAGSVASWEQQARGTTIPASVHVGQVATLGISGAPGETAEVIVSLELLHAQLGGKKGVFNLAAPTIGPVILGTIPASGLFLQPVVFPPAVLHGLEGLRVELQTLTFGADGVMLGNPTSTLVLAAGL